MRKILIIAAVAVLALVGVWALAPGVLGLGPSAPAGARANRAPVVTVATVGTAVFVEEIEAIATALASESVSITAKTADTVGAINFTEGQEVEAGAILIEMTSTAQAADLVAARAELREAEKAYARAADLVAKGIAARATLDAATAARDAARGRVQAIEARLADTIIKAPFAGIVGLRNVSIGSYVRPGDVITTLDDIRVVKGDFTIPEQFLAVLRQGLTLEVEVAAYPGEAFVGTVSSVDTRIDPATRAVKVRADLPNAERKLRPGMLMAASLKVSERTTVAVPESALVAQGSRRFVFKVDGENKAQRVEVKVGMINPGSVEILEGLAEGDRIVTAGTNKVIPGQPVQIDGEPAAAKPVASSGEASRS